MPSSTTWPVPNCRPHHEFVSLLNEPYRHYIRCQPSPHRIRSGLAQNCAPAEEVLIVGATLGAANEIARSLAQTKGASFGYHWMTLGQLASVLAGPSLTSQNTVPLRALAFKPSQAAPKSVINCPAVIGLVVIRNLRADLDSSACLRMSSGNCVLSTHHRCPCARGARSSSFAFQAYERELAEHGFTDWPGVLHIAASAAMDPGCRHQLLALPTLLLDVPLTTASDLGFVDALCSRSPEMLVTVPANDAVTIARLKSVFGTVLLTSTLGMRPSLSKNTMDRCDGFNVTFSTM